MPSYQDIEIRLKVLEDLVGWLTHSMEVQLTVPTGFAGPDGKPAVRLIKKRYIDLYREYKDASLASIAAEAQRSRGAREGGGPIECAVEPTDDQPAKRVVPPDSGKRESFAELRARLGLDSGHLND